MVLNVHLVRALRDILLDLLVAWVLAVLMIKHKEVHQFGKLLPLNNLIKVQHVS